MRSEWRNAGLLLSILVAIATAGSPPVLAASPACEVKAQISPGGQTVPELTGGVPTTVQLNGQPSKDATSYLWVQLSGPSISFDNPHVAKPTFQAPSVSPVGATVVLQLTVTGCSPVQTNSLTTNINVTNVETNLPPVAVITVSPSATVPEGALVTLDGSTSSDPESQPLTYTWEQIGGPAVTLGPDSHLPVVTFTAPGTVPYPDGVSLTFKLTVFDGSLTGTAEQIVNVTWVNDPPVAIVACTSPVNEGDVVTLDGSASSDADNGIASHAWIQTNGLPNADLSGDELSQPLITFPAPQLTSLLDTMSFKLTVTDIGGLASSAECAVIVKDVTPPTITGAGDRTVEATGASGAAVSFNPTAEDLVDGLVDVACSPESGSTFPLGVTSVSCSATDKAGNTGTATFSVTVQDTTPPTLTLPSPITAEATGPAGASVTYSASATDIVDGSITPTCLPASGSTFALGTTTVNCSATDAHGNTATGSFSVTVQDTTPPTLTLPGNLTAVATSNSAAVVTYSASATDIVDGSVTVSCSQASGSSFPVGTTTVNCSATDARGNTANRSFNVTVTYDFAGFFSPIDNLPTINRVKAGQSIPIKFSLHGNQGLAIFMGGYPASGVAACSASDPIDEVEVIGTPGSSGLSYDPGSDQYIYVWKTEKAWAGTCRQLVVRLADGTPHVASFNFTK